MLQSIIDTRSGELIFLLAVNYLSLFLQCRYILHVTYIIFDEVFFLLRCMLSASNDILVHLKINTYPLCVTLGANSAYLPPEVIRGNAWPIKGDADLVWELSCTCTFDFKKI